MELYIGGALILGLLMLVAMFVEGRQAVKEVQKLKAERKATAEQHSKALQELNQKNSRQAAENHDKLMAASTAMKEREVQLSKATEERLAKLKVELQEKYHNEAHTIVAEAASEFPWLARALAQYETLFDFEMGKHLATKKHPALLAARQVSEIAARSRQFREEFHIARQRLDYYESLFPWLTEYVDASLDELLELVKKPESESPEEDPVSRYLAPGEFRSLSSCERNQIALDRYRTRKKSPWELGRDYERFIGYRYERQGYSVEYHGIAEGVSDLGRDLIVRSKDEVKVVQCKYWAAHKEIHEKHVAQLFGTTVKFAIEHGLRWENDVKGILITSTKLSPMAKSFASALGVEFQESVPLEIYPIIKCNVGRDEHGSTSKIYHLPMDQQYDKTRIANVGEFYASTVAEAENHGFRRAWRWHPSDG
jgi:hypothetical protein